MPIGERRHVPWGVITDLSNKNAIGDRSDNDGESERQQPNTGVHGGDALNRLEPDGKEINYKRVNAD